MSKKYYLNAQKIFSWTVKKKGMRDTFTIQPFFLSLLNEHILWKSVSFKVFKLSGMENLKGFIVNPEGIIDIYSSKIIGPWLLKLTKIVRSLDLVSGTFHS